MPRAPARIFSIKGDYMKSVIRSQLFSIRKLLLSSISLKDTSKYLLSSSFAVEPFYWYKIFQIFEHERTVFALTLFIFLHSDIKSTCSHDNDLYPFPSGTQRALQLAPD